MGEFVTINVRLPAEMLKALKRRAIEEDKSVAEIVRASVAYYLLSKDTSAIDYENDPFFSLGKNAAEGPDDAAEHHDRYIYGTPEGRPA